MTGFEYKVVPAPKQGLKARGVKTPEDRFAHAMASLMNTLGAEGWDYLRAESLPSEERHGFTGRTTVTQNVLIFRRALPVAAAAAPAVLKSPVTTAPAREPTLTASRAEPTETTVVRLGPARDDFAAQ
jgi:hypothetical protein